MLKKADKIELTKTLTKGIAEADGFVVCSFQGLTVAHMNELRRELFNNNSKAQVIKNRLLKHALHENGITSMDTYLKESTMIVLGREDAMAAIRVLGKFAKTNDKLAFKAGFVAKTEYSKEEILEISKIPSRIEVIAMIAGGMNAIISRFNGTIEALANKRETEQA